MDEAEFYRFVLHLVSARRLLPGQVALGVDEMSSCSPAGGSSGAEGAGGGDWCGMLAR